MKIQNHNKRNDNYVRKSEPTELIIFIYGVLRFRLHKIHNNYNKSKNKGTSSFTLRQSVPEIAGWQLATVGLGCIGSCWSRPSPGGTPPTWS